MRAPQADFVAHGLKRAASLILTPEIVALRPYIGREIEQGGELWQMWRAACASSHYFSSKVVLSQFAPGRNLITARTHGVLCRLCEDDSIKDLLIEYPRKTLKSSLSTVDHPIHKLMKLATAGMPLLYRYFILSHTMEGVADRHWGEIKTKIEHGTFLRFLYPELTPDPKRGWNATWGYLKGQPQKDPHFEALANRLAGKHHDEGAVDDLIDEQNYRNPDAVDLAHEKFRMTDNLLEGEDSRRIVAGNRWGLRDLNTKIHEEAEATGFVIISINAETGPITSGPWRCKNLPEYAVELLKQMPGPAWPERLSLSYLQKLKIKLGPKIYSAQYLNSPEDPEAQEFDSKLVKRGKIVRHEGEYWFRLTDHETDIPFRDCNFYVTWDPALDGKFSVAESAILVTAVGPGEEKIVVREWAKFRVSPYVAVERFVQFVRAFKPWLHASGMEEVAFQRVMKRPLRKLAEKHHAYLGLRKIKTPTAQSKDQKIRAEVGVEIEAGNVYVLDCCPKTYEQVRLFGTEGMMRDLIDAMSMAAQLWRVPKSRRQREEEEELREMELDDAGPTGYGSALRMHA